MLCMNITLLSLISMIALLSSTSNLVQCQDEFDRMKKSTLELVVQVYRHGARYPIYKTYDGASQMDKNGELTPVGMRQQYELGRKLREEYIVQRKFLSETFQMKELFVRSTDVTRTLQSAQSQLMGLYPLGSGQKIPDEVTKMDAEKQKELLDAPYQLFDKSKLTATTGDYAVPQGYQAIPIHTVEEKRDKLLLGQSYGCPNSKTWTEANKKSEVWQRIRTELAAPLKRFAQIMKQKPEEFDLINLQQTMDTIVTDYFQGREVPQEILDDKDFWTQLEEILILEIHLELFLTEQQKRVSATPFLNTLVGYFEKNLNKTAPYKWYMHSAHDTTVSMILVAMNLTNWECMEKYHTKQLTKDDICLYKPTTYASNLIFELRQDADTQEQYIMFTLNGEYQPICDMKSKYCSLKEFKERVAKQVVPDFDVQCGNTVLPPATNTPKEAQSFTYSKLIVGSYLILILSIIFAF